MQTLCWSKPDSNLYGDFPVKWCFRFIASSLFGAGRAVLRSLIAPHLARGFCPLPAWGNSSRHAGGTSLAKCCFFVRLRAVSSSRPVNRCKRTSLRRRVRLCPGSEQEGPARVAQCPHERRSGARGRCLFAHRGKAGVALSRGFLNSLRPTGSWFFPRSARYERAATWRRGGRHRYVPCAINAVSVSQRKTRGCRASSQRDALPPRVGGFREAIAFGDGPQAVVDGIAVQRYSL